MAIVELYLNTYKSLEPFALMLIEAGLDDDQMVKGLSGVQAGLRAGPAGTQSDE